MSFRGNPSSRARLRPWIGLVATIEPVLCRKYASRPGSLFCDFFSHEERTVCSSAPSNLEFRADPIRVGSTASLGARTIPFRFRKPLYARRTYAYRFRAKYCNDLEIRRSKDVRTFVSMYMGVCFRTGNRHVW